MACEICQSTSEHYSNSVQPCSHQLEDGTDASKIKYTGPDLECLDEKSGVNLETLLKKIDGIVCGGEGVDWSTFDYSCLEDDFTITSAETFAEAISAFVCQFREDYDNYVANNSFNSTGITTTINNVLNPNFAPSCGTVGITSSDTLKSAVQKLINRLCVVDGILSPSAADWNQCELVSPVPTTLNAAFNILINWHCQTQAAIEDIITTGTTLPTFNNESTCLPSPGSSDTLYDTILKIRTVLCALPEFDESEIVWPSCIPEPTDSSLTNIVQAILDPLNTAYQRRIVSVDSSLTLTLDSTSSTCGGYKLGVNPASGLTDRLVAVSSTGTPNYLQNVLLQGTNITFVDNGNTLTVNAAPSDHLVLAGGTSDPPGKLVDKIRENITGDPAITLQPLLDGSGSNSNLYIQPTVDWDVAANSILSAIENNTTLYNFFCTLACGCQPCTTSQGVSKVYIKVNNNHSDAITVLTSLTQNNPTLSFYNGTNIIAGAASFTTGQYTSTSAISPLTASLSIKNDYSATLTYEIKVYDDITNVGVLNSSTLTGNIAAGNTLNFNSFSFGDYKASYRVEITYDIAP